MNFGDTVISEDHSVIGILVYDHLGEKVVVYSSKGKLNYILIDEWLHDWKIYKEKV